MEFKLMKAAFEIIVNNTKDLVFLKDENFIYRACSVPFAKMAEKESPDEVIGKTDYELFDKELADRYRADDSRLIESGKDITLVTKAGIANGYKQLDLAVKLDKKGQVEDMVVDYAAPADYEASMDIFVLSKKWLVQQVKEHIAHNLYHMDRDLVLGLWQKNAATVNVYSFDGIAMFNESVEEYFANSLSLIHKEVRQDLFGGNHPIYTKVRDRVPSFYGENCHIENCSVADGCMLGGNVRNSILFRQVTVYPTAQVEDCVIMNDTVVGEGCQLRYVILDKDVYVRPGAKLMGTPSNPVIVKRGEVV